MDAMVREKCERCDGSGTIETVINAAGPDQDASPMDVEQDCPDCDQGYVLKWVEIPQNQPQVRARVNIERSVSGKWGFEATVEVVDTRAADDLNHARVVALDQTKLAIRHLATIFGPDDADVMGKLAQAVEQAQEEQSK